MGRLIVICSFLVALQLTFGEVSSKDQFELREGDCNRIQTGDIVFQDHAHLTRMPLVTRSTTSSFKSHMNIYCIIAHSMKEASKGSTVSIKEGGINQTYVTLEFRSAKNHGLEYRVQVYGKD